MLALPEGLSHVAIIMDGNGRWANQRGLPRVRGHKEGVKSVRAVTTASAEAGLEQLTLYALSVENFFKRPKAELAFLLGLLKRFVIQERKTIMENNIKFRVIGRIDAFPKSLQDEIARLTEVSSSNSGMTLCLALNYGDRAEIADGVRRIAEKVVAGELLPESIDEDTVAAHLYDPGMPEPDLLIRTAGEMRISNFLLWQVSYAEIYVTEELWPGFRLEALEQALASYSGRKRKFGGLLRKADA